MPKTQALVGLAARKEWQKEMRQTKSISYLPVSRKCCTSLKDGAGRDYATKLSHKKTLNAEQRHSSLQKYSKFKDFKQRISIKRPLGRNLSNYKIRGETPWHNRFITFKPIKQYNFNGSGNSGCSFQVHGECIKNPEILCCSLPGFIIFWFLRNCTKSIILLILFHVKQAFRIFRTSPSEHLLFPTLNNPKSFSVISRTCAIIFAFMRFCHIFKGDLILNMFTWPNVLP